MYTEYNSKVISKIKKLLLIYIVTLNNKNVISNDIK